ncbi:hypothetical protein HGRIS_004115 [Hohenbuehelia grisea]|uniref:Uncharacterized protein n=1 Tax=Hohenbuehelia grisea TaxID=104357 RepID=A0ABR3JHQ2_9AGAR
MYRASTTGPGLKGREPSGLETASTAAGMEGVLCFGGSFLIAGACLALPLYGVAVGQAVSYYRTYTADRLRLKLVVAVLLSVVSYEIYAKYLQP